MKILKDRKSGVLVKVTDRVADQLLKRGVYTYSTKGAYKRQTKLLARGRATLQQVGAKRPLRDRLRRDRR